MDNISVKEKLAFGIGAYGKDLVYGIVSVFIMVYYTDVVQVSPVFIGGLFLVARIWDAINDPMMGLIVDNTHTKYGKFRPWILGGTVINSIVLALMFLNPADFLQGTLVYAWCAITYILWGMTYTLMDVPYWSMIPAFSNDSKVRDTMSVIPRLFAMFGNSTITTFGLMIIAFLGVNMGGSTSDGYFRFALIIAILFNVCEVICFLFTREHVVTEAKESIKPADAFKLIRDNDQLLVIILLTVLKELGVYLFLGMNVYFYKYVVMDESWFALFGAVSFGSQLLAFATFPKFVDKFSRKTAYLTSMCSFIAGMMGMFFFTSSPGSSSTLFMVFAALFNIGSALVCVSTTVMLADTCDYGEYKTGKRTEAIVFSAQTLSVKFGSAVAGAMGGLMLEFVGYVPNVEQTAETIMGLRMLMFVLSSILFALIVVLYIKFYKLNGKFYNDMLGELNLRRERDRAMA